MRRSRQQRDRVTIQDVAQRAGVSAMTVSNVVNRTGKVGESTRARVRAIIEEMGYVPSQAARHLVGAAPARIGLIYLDIESMFLSLAHGEVSAAAAEKGLQLMVRRASAATPDRAAAVALSLVRSGADALLFIPPFAELLTGTPALRTLGVPAAAIATAGPLPDMATVRIDNHAAGRAVADLLVARGYRRIAIITGPGGHSDSVARLDGYKAALAAHGIPFRPELCAEGLFSFETGLVAADTLLDLSQPPDAIMAANDDMAAAALWAAHRRGLVPPRDLAVTGFDDTLVATRVWPALTTVRQPIKDMAIRAIDLLVEALGRPAAERAAPATTPRDVVLDFTLVERGSVRQA
ncbi:LacI family DNA-binding transcriptional regulator [Nitrospirillum viridazoti]|uniref:LacI family transcriptional regulator n=1 Tax=Nitrospirillum viridazoti CBAmc TaxID=1441467 RepID=A0A248JYP6_9PROT|nr:LacI family DNA-binding transcriptional regulator [Nitrospirillum amazonense]ASG23853.1 LacI family transcriptional regulator [Nitrospirillum amazonense CBAmc]TWB44727.1 LacI family transcriptional regulator [Nitrospirillum amazonense]